MIKRSYIYFYNMQKTQMKGLYKNILHHIIILSKTNAFIFKWFNYLLYVKKNYRDDICFLNVICE
jgi:hypothetical protein